MNSTTDQPLTGIVFNIQKYSVHDGPGIRTVVFLKGCPLRCKWCSNPESQDPRIQLAYNDGRCIGLSDCGRCAERCVPGAISAATSGHININRNLCPDCLIPCAAACPAHALITYGEHRNVADVIGCVEQDSTFYSRSGGGMTISGGEPLFQSKFALALLAEARRRRVNTAIETCGNVAWEVLDQACGMLNILLFDIKNCDSAKHKEGTGVPNELILANFRRVQEHHPKLPVLVRTPVIPGFNDRKESIAAILDFLEPYPNVRYELLPYHRLGTQKYHFLGREAPMGDVKLDNARFAELQKLVAERRPAPIKQP